MSDLPLYKGKLLKSVGKADMDFITACFNMADKGRKGFLTREELKCALVASFGYKPSTVEINNILSKFGCLPKGEENTEGLCSRDDLSSPKETSAKFIMPFQPFIDIVKTKLALSDPVDDIRETFQYLDQYCKGFIDFDDFKRIACSVLPHSHASTLQKAFRELDRDNDGRVSFRDFEYMMEQSL